MAWTLDHVGPICKTVEDAAVMLGVIAGFDEMDPTTIDMQVPDYTAAFKMRVSKLRLGLPRAGFFENLDPEYGKAVEGAIDVLRKLTASVTQVNLPRAVAAPLIWGPETYAYHAKWLTQSPGKYQAATRALMIRSDDVKPEAYAEARRQVDLVRREIKTVFQTMDLLVTPTMKIPPATIAASLKAAAPPPATPAQNGGGGNSGNPWAFDVYGVPAITLPCGFTSAGLPIGLQISAAPFAETTMLALAHAYERATEWHTRRPTIGGAA
jgi:aspartyl-tRNA(Asn)/glutamyl-tRNA(Gln) amidotransferase subunit A